ncbi:hypothetical protein AB2S56_000555 [Haloparvum sp. AD34]
MVRQPRGGPSRTNAILRGVSVVRTELHANAGLVAFDPRRFAGNSVAAFGFDDDLAVHVDGIQRSDQ